MASAAKKSCVVWFSRVGCVYCEGLDGEAGIRRPLFHVSCENSACDDLAKGASVSLLAVLEKGDWWQVVDRRRVLVCGEL